MAVKTAHPEGRAISSLSDQAAAALAGHKMKFKITELAPQAKWLNKNQSHRKFIRGFG